MHCRLLTLTLLMFAIASSAYAGDANPGYDRPGIGFTPAALQAGDVIWEQGLPDISNADGTTLYSADSLFRLGLGRGFELQVGTTWNHLSDSAASPSGWGGTSAGIKFSPSSYGSFSWGLLGSVTFTDGSRAFANHERLYLVGAAFNWQLDASDGIGAYLETTQQGGRNNQLIAVNASRSFSQALGGYVELAWQHDGDAGSGTMGGAGVTYMASPNVQLDASVRHRINGSADTWQGGLGVSVYFGPVL